MLLRLFSLYDETLKFFVLRVHKNMAVLMKGHRYVQVVRSCTGVNRCTFSGACLHKGCQQVYRGVFISVQVSTGVQRFVCIKGTGVNRCRLWLDDRCAQTRYFSVKG